MLQEKPFYKTTLLLQIPAFLSQWNKNWEKCKKRILINDATDSMGQSELIN